MIKYRELSMEPMNIHFLIDDEGISVLPITSLLLNNKASSQRVSTGIASIDEMLRGKGFFSGSSILVSGTAGTGKTSIAAYFANASCQPKGTLSFPFCF